jgi:hypothetical protein
VEEFFVTIIQELQNEFYSRFTDYHTRKCERCFFRNLFDSGMDSFPVEVEKDITKLQAR